MSKVTIKEALYDLRILRTKVEEIQTELANNAELHEIFSVTAAASVTKLTAIECELLSIQDCIPAEGV